MIDIYASIRKMKRSLDEFMSDIDASKSFSERERKLRQMNLITSMIGTLGAEKEKYGREILLMRENIKKQVDQGLPTDILKETFENLTFAYVAAAEALAFLKSSQSVAPLNMQTLSFARDLLANAEKEICGKTKNPIKKALNSMRVGNSPFGSHVTDDAYEKRRKIAKTMVPIIIETGDIENSLKKARFSVDNGSDKASDEYITDQPHIQGEFPESENSSEVAQVEKKLLNAQPDGNNLKTDLSMLNGQTNPNIPK